MLAGKRQDPLFSSSACAAGEAGGLCAMSTFTDETEFERRTRQLLQDSIEALPAATRSRLTRARHAALASRPSWTSQLSWHWMPAGASVLAVAAVAIFMALPHG